MPSASPGSAALCGLTFSVAGAGRVGTSLAAWAESQGAVRVESAGRGGIARLATAGQELLLVAVPDRALPEVVAELARRPQARIALHTAGGVTGEVLRPLAAHATAVGSFHPLKAFPRALPEIAEARGIFFALDGDAAAQELGHRLAAAWGASAAAVAETARPLYHFAATLAAGGAVTLLAVAAEIASRLGLPPAAVSGYSELCRGAVEEVRRVEDPADALTGPAVRGDRATLESHLDALAAAYPEKLDLACSLLAETLRQIGRRHPLTAEQQGIVEDLAAHGQTI
jgi:predicted short-subunit dehydrogenase-like oxidoreductase (DUF2520 family)